MGNITSVWQRASARPILSASALAAATWVLWILFLPTHPWSKHISNLGLTVMPLVAARQCVAQARGVAGRLRRGWMLMGGSCLAWGLGMVVWSAYESIGGRDVPFPSLADLGYLATVPLAVAALLIFPTAPQRAAAEVRTVVDGLLTVLLLSGGLVASAVSDSGSATSPCRRPTPAACGSSAAIGLAAGMMIGALLRGEVDPFVFWVGLFLVAALVARRVLVALERAALERSVEAWVPPQWGALEDWIPTPPAPRSPRRPRQPVP